MKTREELMGHFKNRVGLSERVLENIESIKYTTHLENHWHFEDKLDSSNSAYHGRSEHHTHLLTDPVYEALQMIRDHTVDGSGDPFRNTATDIMHKMIHRELPEKVYNDLYQKLQEKETPLRIPRLIFL